MRIHPVPPTRGTAPPRIAGAVLLPRHDRAGIIRRGVGGEVVQRAGGVGGAGGGGGDGNGLLRLLDLRLHARARLAARRHARRRSAQRPRELSWQRPEADSHAAAEQGASVLRGTILQGVVEVVVVAEGGGEGKVRWEEVGGSRMVEREGEVGSR